MKRIERKHLKENELAERVRAVREFVEPRQSIFKTIGIVVVLAVVAAAAYGAWRERSRSAGQEALAEALVALNAQVVPTGVEGAEGVPAAAQINATGTFATEEAKLNAAVPKLKAAADTYPGSAAGIQARYHLAGALATLGRHEEAIAAFDEVINRAGNSSLYGRMAQLGKADAQARGGQIDAAIDTWKSLATSNDENVPVDAVLMQLARAYAQKGNQEEARRTLTEIVDEYPQSPYTEEARTELENIKG